MSRRVSEALEKAGLAAYSPEPGPMAALRSATCLSSTAECSPTPPAILAGPDRARLGPGLGDSVFEGSAVKSQRKETCMMANWLSKLSVFYALFGM